MEKKLLIMFLSLTSLSLYSQDWLDDNLYPFDSNYVQLEQGKMHYVDTGKGDVILFVHGTPTWSFLYRNYIKKLSENYRCIAIDHIGFGLSEKPEDFDGKPETHSKNLTEFIQKLDLDSITMVVHDFGGPIGLSSAISNDSRIKQIIMFNTWLGETNSNEELKKADKIINSTLGRFLYLRLNYSPKSLLKKGFQDKKNLTKQIHRHYYKPFPSKASRYSLLNIAKSLVGSSDFYELKWNELAQIENKPWLILWGNQDDFISIDYLEKWKNRLPHAKVVEFEAGHFLQEEKFMETLNEIKLFLK
ncbi:alpha/beta fold hydrolase [Winogradskyella poriferorum]|mgnify:CR=1 FL=1|uniref:Alpha/beta fold hydrolase n=1 Tax=Winogradskyella poriferorum TaxID=307627 RepID=A0ABU7W073_9FLAO